MSNPLKVRELNGYIEKLLLTNPILSNIEVVGEVSNFRKSGNIAYFNLQDDLKKEVLRCVSFNAAIFNEILVEDGHSIICHGSVQTYSGQSIYQLIVQRVRKEGLGEAAEKLRILREKLYREGLFDDSHKKTLPQYTFKVGLITSPEGAAVKDFIKVAHRRNPRLQIILYPTRVQGIQAMQSIREGIDIFNNKYPVDVIVITRGGGSSEDLDVFNEEMLVRSIFQSLIPIVTAIGHERDFTLVDLVSDKRAATPSEAAEAVSFDLDALLYDCQKKIERLTKQVESRWRNNTLYLDQLSRVLQARAPFRVIEMHENFNLNLKKRLDQQLTLRLKTKSDLIAQYKMRIENANPIKPLERGYVLVYNQRSMIKTAQEALKHNHLELQFIDGTVPVVLEKRGDDD